MKLFPREFYFRAAFSSLLRIEIHFDMGLSLSLSLSHTFILYFLYNDMREYEMEYEIDRNNFRFIIAGYKHARGLLNPPELEQ